jgi:hypothetical protein
MCKTPSVILDCKDRKLKIEIYSSTSNAHRRPLARERTMLLDQPLELVEQRGSMVQDVAGSEIRSDHIWQRITCSATWWSG